MDWPIPYGIREPSTPGRETGQGCLTSSPLALTPWDLAAYTLATALENPDRDDAGAPGRYLELVRHTHFAGGLLS